MLLLFLQIVTLGMPVISPVERVGKYVKPRDWNKLISDPDTVSNFTCLNFMVYYSYCSVANCHKLLWFSSSIYLNLRFHFKNIKIYSYFTIPILIFELLLNYWILPPYEVHLVK